MKRLIARTLLVFLLILQAKADLAAEKQSNSEPEKGEYLKIYKPAKVDPGFTLVPLDGNARVDLVDIAGHVVHSWDVDATRARLLPNGHLLVIHGSKWGAKQKKWKKLRSLVAEYDWNGKRVWSFKSPDVAHHDLQRLPNGNTIFLRRFMVPEEFKDRLTEVERRQQPIRGDGILEVDSQGNVVWEWRAHEHLDLNSCGKKGCQVWKGRKRSLTTLRDWTHMNTVIPIPENKWYREGHKAFRPGNIMVLARNWWTTFIIDKESKKVVWEYTGGDYKGGICGGHESHIIPEGYPGAGNLLIFDNGRKTHEGESYILEVNPISGENVWVYDAGRNFYSMARGAMQRLSNGNTLISEDNEGRCFEVTPEKEIVWLYQHDGLETNRCRRYPVDYAPQLRNFVQGRP